jgi:hypothetical protein
MRLFDLDPNIVVCRRVQGAIAAAKIISMNSGVPSG